MSTIIFEKDFDYTDLFTFSCGCKGFNEEIEHYKFYCDQVELSFVESDKKLQDELDAKLKDAKCEEERENLIDSYGWDLSLSQFKYPSILRESIFLTTYNQVEHYLNHLCKILEHVADHKFTLNDTAGKGRTRAFTFLMNTLAINLDHVPHYQFLVEANRLRNIIVHNGSILPAEITAKPNKFIAKYSVLLGGDPECRVLLGKEFIPTFISKMERMFEYLSEQSIDYFKRVKPLKE